MGTPRIKFTIFADPTSSKLGPWHEHRRRVIGAPAAPSRPAAETDQPAVVWQLLSGNHRELARSADVFASVHAAMGSATEVLDFAAGLGAVVLSSDERQRAYGWYLRVFDEPAVLCARWYGTERESRHALKRALVSMDDAELALVPRQYVEIDSAEQASEV